MGEALSILLGSFLILLVLLAAQILTAEDDFMGFSIGILIAWTFFVQVFIESIGIIIGG